MSIVYNRITRNPERIYRIEGERVVDPHSPEYNDYWYNAYLSKELLIRDDHSGVLSWIDDGKLYVATCTATWDYIPLQANTLCISTGYEGTAYCVTQEEAEQWAACSPFRHDGIAYQEEFDIYTVHYYIDPVRGD